MWDHFVRHLAREVEARNGSLHAVCDEQSGREYVAAECDFLPIIIEDLKFYRTDFDALAVAETDLDNVANLLADSFVALAREYLETQQNL